MTRGEAMFEAWDPAGGRYTVQEGDNFGSIAAQLSLLGRKVTPYELIKYNYNVDPQRIRPGQVLVVPTVRGEYRKYM